MKTRHAAWHAAAIAVALFVGGIGIPANAQDTPPELPAGALCAGQGTSVDGK
jgi:hypothetical protein